MKINYSKTSLKQLKNLPGTNKYNPYAGKKLKDALNNFISLKVWPYHIIYQYSDNDKVIFIY
jgi:mRNA-degrading endonuclease RelE of RelBE toxin-antitoxin system